MQRLIYATLLLLLTTTCTKEEEFFYTTTYPVTEIDCRFTLSEEADEALEALMEQLSAEVKATAPVQAGGRYWVGFNRPDGGVLRVDPQADSETIVGSFTKVPASSQMTFTYGEEEYTVRVTGEMNTEEQFCTLFEVNLTAQYRERYAITDPEFSIVRIERTSHLYD